MAIDYNTNFNIYETVKANPGISSIRLRKAAENSIVFKKSISYLVTSGRIYYDHSNKRYFPA